MELVQKTKEELTASNDEVSGSIHIGSGETRAFRAVAAALRTLIGQYPAVRFHLYSGNSQDVMERLDFWRACGRAWKSGNQSSSAVCNWRQTGQHHPKGKQFRLSSEIIHCQEFFLGLSI